MATAESLRPSLTPGESSTALASQWRVLTRATTVVAILTSPAAYLWFHRQQGWAWYWSLAGMEDGILFSLGRTPGLSVSDVTVPYVGTSATFTVTLDFPRTTPITVNYATANGTALAGTNYTATSGMLTFAPGQKSRTITVAVNPQSVTGASANFFVNSGYART